MLTCKVNVHVAENSADLIVWEIPMTEKTKLFLERIELDHVGCLL